MERKAGMKEDDDLVENPSTPHLCRDGSKYARHAKNNDGVGAYE